MSDQGVINFWQEHKGTKVISEKEVEPQKITHKLDRPLKWRVAITSRTYHSQSAIESDNVERLEAFHQNILHQMTIILASQSRRSQSK